MTRHVLTLSKHNRAKAILGVDRAPDGWVLELREAKRTDEQNAAIHGLIAQILKQRPVHRGQRMTKETYKAAFLHALGQEMQFIPALDGDGYFPMGHRTSTLTKGEFSNLMEWALAWCAREGIAVSHFDQSEAGRDGGAVVASPVARETEAA